MLPSMSGIVLTALVVLVIIFFLRAVISRYGYGLAPF
jgi:YggT family protein